MKAEHRHELQQNSMIRFFGRIKAKLQHGPSRKTVIIGGVILLAVIVLVVWKIVSNLAESRSSRRTMAVLNLQPAEAEKGEFSGPEVLWARARDEFIRENSDTVQAHWVELQQARADYRDGLEKLFDKLGQSEAKKKLGGAATSFEKLAKDLKSTPILVEECLLSAGRCYEAIGELDSAESLYKRVSGSGEFGKQAERLADRIAKRRTELAKLTEAIEKPPEPPPPPEPPKKDDKPNDKPPPKKDDKPKEPEKKNNTPP